MAARTGDRERLGRNRRGQGIGPHAGPTAATGTPAATETATLAALLLFFTTLAGFGDGNWIIFYLCHKNIFLVN